MSHRRTVCEVLREIYASPGVTSEIQGKCIEATVMVKKMNAKLIEYKTDWDAGAWQKNPNYTYEIHMQKLLQSGNDGSIT